MPSNIRPGPKRPALVPLVLNPVPPRRSSSTLAQAPRLVEDDFTIFPDVASPSSSPPPTPRRQRVKDMVGEENLTNLPSLLAKLKTVMHRVPKSQVVQRSVISSLTDGYKETQPDFLCAQAEFANAMILIDLCLTVASSPTKDNPPFP